MELGLKHKNCIITGGSRGIGLAIAQGLAAEGANVAICARTKASLQQAEAALREHGVTVHARSCDVADPQALAAFLDGAREALGGVDILIHNASALATGPTLADWDASLQVDVMGAARACAQVTPWMAEAGGGTILFVSSVSGLEVFPAPDFAYTAAKAALIAYAKKLAVLLAPQRIRVNAIAPGSTEFPGGLWETIRQSQPAMYEAARGSIPWGRMATAQEIADVAVFLVSPRAGWVVGECVSVDGGQHRGMR